MHAHVLVEKATHHSNSMGRIGRYSCAMPLTTVPQAPSWKQTTRQDALGRILSKKNNQFRSIRPVERATCSSFYLPMKVLKASALSIRSHYSGENSSALRGPGLRQPAGDETLDLMPVRSRTVWAWELWGQPPRTSWDLGHYERRARPAASVQHLSCHLN